MPTWRAATRLLGTKDGLFRSLNRQSAPGSQGVLMHGAWNLPVNVRRGLAGAGAGCAAVATSNAAQTRARVAERAAARAAGAGRRPQCVPLTGRMPALAFTGAPKTGRVHAVARLRRVFCCK